jgi:hypothetical protein
VLQTKENTILVCQDGGIYDFVDFTTMHRLSHVDVPGVKASSKSRLLMRAGQIGVADDQGLVFLVQKPGGAGATLLELLPEKYFKGKSVTDFVEYQRDMFIVSMLDETHFHFINRADKKTAAIRSLNAGFVTLGIQMMPQYELQYALVRDTRGLQLLNLITMTAHQLFLSPCETHLPDLRFLQVLYDEETQRYSVVTIHKASSSEEEEENVGFASEI